MATHTAETEGKIVAPRHSTEELCREASEKLSIYHSTFHPGTPQCEDYNNGASELKTTSHNAREDLKPPMDSQSLYRRSPGDAPPPYSAVVETALQLPLEREDLVSSFRVPPPPPPSPGDALLGRVHRSVHPAPQSRRPLPQLCNQDLSPIPHAPPPPPLPPSVQPQYGDSEEVPTCRPTPSPSQHFLGHPYSVPNPLFHANPLASPYATRAAAPSVPIAMQQPQTVTQTISSNQVPTTNLNNVNVVVQNNIGLEQNASSYICFSVCLLILCLSNPLGLLFAIPAVCCSSIACCTSDYKRAKMMGKCALRCDIIALSVGIATFVVLIIPGIVVGVLFGVGILGAANALTALGLDDALDDGLYDGLYSY